MKPTAKPSPPNSPLPPILAVVGQTAVGKTELAIEIADRIGAEIVSADSMQVYRRMDIGSAKPSPEELSRVPHHLIDVVDPETPFSVAEYRKLAEPYLRAALEGGRPIVVCGGTGLYFKALFDGLADSPPPDRAFRQTFAARAEAEGTGPIYEELKAADPNAAEKIHPNDKKRIIRALEILHATGMTKTEFEATQASPPWKDRVAWIGIVRPWEDLVRRIETRVDRMFEAGLLEEVRGLVDSGLGPEHTAMQGLGYKEVLDHLSGSKTLEETVDLIKQGTRRFARRQMTWTRNDPRIRWIEVSDEGERICFSDLAEDLVRVLSKDDGGAAPENQTNFL